MTGYAATLTAHVSYVITPCIEAAQALWDAFM